MAVSSVHASPDALVARRWELYHSAAPLFEGLGFRGVTVADLARACLISPAGLYHYFPNKAWFALFPLTRQSGLCHEWGRRLSTLPVDPLVRLHALIEFLFEYSAEVRLSIRLSGEITYDRRFTSDVARVVGEAKTDFAQIAGAVDQTVTPKRASDLFDGLVAVLVGDLPGTERHRSDLHRQLIDIARGWVTSFGVSAAQFDAASPAAPPTADRPTGRPLPLPSAQRERAQDLTTRTA